MELLPEENFIFITSMFGAAYCFYKVSNKFIKRKKEKSEREKEREITKKSGTKGKYSAFHRKQVYF